MWNRGITRVIKSHSTPKNLKHKCKSSHFVLFFLSKKTHSLKSRELGFIAQRRSFSPLFGVQWFSLCVVNTSPPSFIFHFHFFPLLHPWGFHGKGLVFGFESDFGLVLGMDNALVVWIASGVEESFLLGPKVSSFVPFLHLKAISLGLIGKGSFIVNIHLFTIYNN